VGFYKERQIDQGELGYFSPGGDVVCDECVADVALKALIAEKAIAERCGFCGREEDHPIAADTDDVLERIGRSLQREWDDPNNVLFYDSEEESGYIGAPVLDTAEVLGEEPAWPFANDAFERFVLDAFSDAQWPAGPVRPHQVGGAALQLGPLLSDRQARGALRVRAHRARPRPRVRGPR
jgi:hypothetical protein